MATATLDPTATIAHARDELVDELRQLVDRGLPVDELLDAVGKLTSRIRRRLNGARKAMAAETGNPRPHDGVDRTEPKIGPTTPSGVSSTARPAPADDKPKTTPAKTVPARTTPTPQRATVVLKPLPTSPAPRPSIDPVKPIVIDRPGSGRHRRPARRPAWLLLALLVALVVGLALTAGVGWALAGAAITTAALITRARWPRLATTIRKPWRTS